MSLGIKIATGASSKKPEITKNNKSAKTSTFWRQTQIIMKQLLFILTVVIALSSCRKSENYSNSSANQLFRSKYHNTSWSNDSVGIITFQQGKMLYYSDAGQSYYYVEGTYNNIYSDGCVYPTVINSIDSEDNGTFVCRATWTSGAGSSCQGGTATLTFQIVNENTIQMINREGNWVETTSLNKINTVSTQNAIDGTANGYLW